MSAHERADAEYFTDSASPTPNAEMTLLAVVDAALLSVRQGGTAAGVGNTNDGREDSQP